jgi:putative protease
VLVRNLGSAEFLRRRLPWLSLVGDASLNVANELAAGVLLAEGLTRLTPAVDLSFHQLLAMMERVSPEVLEVVIHQHVPMFHMEHCLFAARLSSGSDRRTCGRPCSRRRVELLDRVGEAHPLLSDPRCRNTVYNAHAQSAAQYLPALVARGLRHFRVELLREGPADVGPLLDCYADVLAGRQDGAGAWRRVQAVCRSRVTRGTLQEQDAAH